MTRRKLFFRPAALLFGLLLLAGPMAEAQKVTAIAAAGNHSLFTKADGSLWAMGDNSFGQLGIGPNVDMTNVPQRVFPGGVGLIAAGYGHSIFQISNTVWAMGNNQLGQLGDGTTNDQVFPEQIFVVASNATFSTIAGGDDDTLIGTSIPGGGGGLWVVGGNNVHDLGDGTTNQRAVFEEILTNTLGSNAVTSIGTGEGYFNLFVKADGSLWGMGDDTFGELGDGRTLAVAPIPVPIVPNNVVAVAAGGFHTLFIKSDGSLWAMGENPYGQLGNGNFANTNRPVQIVPGGVVAVAAGGSHSLFIKTNGSLWAMGVNAFGQLGDGVTTLRTNLPEQIVPGGVIAVAAGDEFSLFLKSDGSLWGMGANSYGQLGDGSYSNRFTPVEIVAPPPVSVSIGIKLSGANVLLTWPANAAGFKLQSTTNLVPSAVWSNVPGNPGIIAGQFTLTNPIPAKRQFYRLSQ